MQNHTIVTLKKGEGRTIKAGGMWIFDNEIDTITGSFHNGDVVTVHDFDGYPMGRGFINQNSKIRIRLMTRKTEQEIDRDFLRMRVKNAWEYRKTTVDTPPAASSSERRIFCRGLSWTNMKMCLLWNVWHLAWNSLRKLSWSF